MTRFFCINPTQNPFQLIINVCFLLYVEICFLSNDIYDYYIVSQGKTTIPNLDDGEECVLTDVSLASQQNGRAFSKLQVFQCLLHVRLPRSFSQRWHSDHRASELARQIIWLKSVPITS